MNAALAGAAGLVLALGAAHSYLGERYILIRLFRRPDLPTLFGSDVFTKRTLRFAWHLTTVAWWGLGALLLAAARSGDGTISVAQFGTLLAAIAFASAGVTLVGSRGRHLAWPVFAAIGVLAWLGTH